MRRGRLRAAVAALSLLVVLIAACSTSTGAASGNTRGAGGQGFTMLTPRQLHRMMAKQDVFLVNVHVPYEGEIPGTDAFIPYTEIASRLSELPFDTEPVVVYCRSGVTSGQAAAAMAAAGAPPFYELQGGYTAWQAAGYQLVIRQP
jgi:phage shock protein E